MSSDLELAKKIIKNFENPKVINHKQINLLNEYGEKILEDTTAELNAYLK